MKLVTYVDDGSPRVGVLDGDLVRATDLTDMGQAIAAASLPSPGAEVGAVDDVRLLAPVLRPGKLLFCGINYASHKQENPSAVLPAEPFFFSKLPSAVVGHGDAVRIPGPESQVDYEVELAMVIGKGGRGISQTGALEHVFGYTVMDDISGRDVQFRDHQITLGKGFDTFAPMGPCVVTRDEIPDPQALFVSSYVNGELRQHEPTANMLFTCATLIEFVSRHITLEPGDIVTTGTPAGVGTFRDPPLFLAPGDVVDVEVDAVGRLRNTVVAGWE
jgi:2-keto-4-pentenoate hydratase/2-oxohepta-3-ene-1,7-dioic acid hydratase in catechol pathway